MKYTMVTVNETGLAESISRVKWSPPFLWFWDRNSLISARPVSLTVTMVYFIQFSFLPVPRHIRVPRYRSIPCFSNGLEQSSLLTSSPP